MRGHGQEGSAEDAGPEGVGSGEVHGEVEHVELAGGGGDRVDVRPAALDVRAKRCDRNEGAPNIDEHLDYVRPDNGGEAAFEGIEQGERGDDGDAEDVFRADGDAHDNADGEDSDAFGSGAGKKKEASGDFVEDRAEAAVDELIGREHFSGEVAGEEEQRYDHAANHVADD